MLADAYPDDKSRGRAFGIVMSFFAVGVLLGPLWSGE